MYIAAGKYLKSSFGLHGIWWPKKIMILKQGRYVTFTTCTVLRFDFHISGSLLSLSCVLVFIGKIYSLLLNYRFTCIRYLLIMSLSTVISYIIDGNRSRKYRNYSYTLSKGSKVKVGLRYMGWWRIGTRKEVICKSCAQQLPIFQKSNLKSDLFLDK